MENLLSLKTEHATHNTEISIDNSTEFKDFVVKQTRNTNTPNTFSETLSFQIHRHDDKSKVSLEIGKFSLFGREVELLKEFLNQY